jgi:hypothetical protein
VHTFILSLPLISLLPDLLLECTSIWAQAHIFWRIFHPGSFLYYGHHFRCSSFLVIIRGFTCQQQNNFSIWTKKSLPLFGGHLWLSRSSVVDLHILIMNTIQPVHYEICQQARKGNLSWRYSYMIKNYQSW